MAKILILSSWPTNTNWSIRFEHHYWRKPIAFARDQFNALSVPIISSLIKLINQIKVFWNALTKK